MKADPQEADFLFMGLALDEARMAADEGEAPVGAVAVKNGEVVAKARNSKERLNDPTRHAEIDLIRKTSAALGAWRLTGVSVYVTLEPCPMCAGALVLARIDRLIYGAADPKMGAVRTLYEIADDPRLNHRMAITEGVRAAECGGALSEFFAARRKPKKA